MGFIAFSVLSSVVYIINDLRDREKDRLHSKKRNRPLASGKISPQNAKKLMVILLFILAALMYGMNLSQNMMYAAGILLVYLAVNIAYSFGAKNIPIIDIIILASGYILRVVFGGIIIDTGISFWLYLVITLCAFYLGFGKRRNEIMQQGAETRAVLKGYTYNFLDKNMYVCQTLCIVFYSLWSIDANTIQRLHTSAFVFTVPVVFLILLKYSLTIERDSDGDPTTVLLQDKVLMLLCAIYMVFVFCILYMNGGVK
jgi:4-hydroxybenzoate polyprenyltransferase